MIARRLIWGGLLLCLNALNAQALWDNPELDQENLSTEIIEHLDQLRQHPLNLNACSLHDLLHLPWISQIHAIQIIHQRLTRGPFQNFKNLIKRCPFLESAADQIRPYLSIQPLTAFKNKSKLQIQSRWHGFFSSNHYNAQKRHPLYQRQRLMFSTSQVKGAVLIEKDPGEPLWADHVSAYLEGVIPATSLHWTAGHFRAECGQGLVLWSPWAFPDASRAFSPIKKGGGLVGHKSSEEYHAFFGLALSRQTPSHQLFIFGATQPRDASGSPNALKGLITQGYHRTRYEREHRHNIQETIGGFRFEHTFAFGHVGVTGWQNRFSRTFEPADSLRKRHAFRGRIQGVAGMDYHLQLDRVFIQGETAVTRDGGLATLHFLGWRTKASQLCLGIRHATASFQNPYSHGFDRSPFSNETGYYIGLEQKISSQWRMTLTLDISKPIWRTYFNALPLFNRKMQGWSQYRVNRKLIWIIKGLIKRRQHIANDLLIASNIYSEIKQDLILNLRQYHKSQIRVTFNRNQNQKRKEHGFLCFIKHRWQLAAWSNLSLRALYFSSPSYDTRLYEFEGHASGWYRINDWYGNGHAASIKWSVAFGAHCEITLNWRISNCNKPETSQKNIHQNHWNIQFDLSF